MTEAVATAPDASAAAVAVETPFRRFVGEFFASRIATVALATLGVIVALALIAPWITPQNPYDLAQVDVLDGRLPPGETAFAGYTMWLGSDGAGRDLQDGLARDARNDEKVEAERRGDEADAQRSDHHHTELNLVHADLLRQGQQNRR